MSAEDQRSRLARYVGLAIAGLGLAHFTNPTFFDPLTSQAFSKRTRQHTYIDGAVEAALGLGLAGRRTRRLATLGTMGYLTYLGRNVMRKTF